MMASATMMEKRVRQRGRGGVRVRVARRGGSSVLSNAADRGVSESAFGARGTAKRRGGGGGGGSEGVTRSSCRSDEEWLQRRREELQGLRVADLRALLATHASADAGAIKATRKDTMLQEVMKREVEREVRGRRTVLVAARRRHRRVAATLGGRYGRGRASGSFSRSASLIEKKTEGEEIEEGDYEALKELTLRSFTEQVVMLHETTRLVQRVQGKVLTGELQPRLGGSVVPLETLEAADVIDGLAACIKVRYETSRRYRTLFADLRREGKGHVRAVIDLDPDEGDMKIVVVRERFGGNHEYYEEKREVVDVMLNRFDMSERFASESLLRAAITARRERVRADWADSTGELINAEVLECRGEGALVRVSAIGRDAESVVAELDEAHATPGEVLRVGDVMKVVVTREHALYSSNNGVDVGDATLTPHLMVSRTEAALVSELIKLEVDAFRDGVATVFSVARVAGLTTKVGVDMTHEKDRSSASLRHAITQALAKVGTEHLHGETVVPVFKSDSMEKMISDALSFTDVGDVRVEYNALRLGRGDGRARVYVQTRELCSKLLQDEGSTIELASSLLGVHISVLAAEDEEEEEVHSGGDTGSRGDVLGETDLKKLRRPFPPFDVAVDEGPTPSFSLSRPHTSELSAPRLDGLSRPDPELKQFIEDVLQDTAFRVPVSSSSDSDIDDSTDFLDLAARGGTVEERERLDVDGVSSGTRRSSSSSDSLSSMIDEVLGDAGAWDGLSDADALRDVPLDRGDAHATTTHGGGNFEFESPDDMLDDLMFGLADLDDSAGDASLEGSLPSSMSAIPWETVGKGLSPPRGPSPRAGGADHHQGRLGTMSNDDDDGVDVRPRVRPSTSWQNRNERGSSRTSRRTVFYHENGVEPQTCAEKKEMDGRAASRLGVRRQPPTQKFPYEERRGAGDRRNGRERPMRFGVSAKSISLKLGPLFFPHSDAAYSFFSSMLWESEIGYVLRPDEMDVFVDLIERAHPDPVRKLGASGLQEIYVGKTQKQVEGRMKAVRAFMLARKDGSEDDCSYRKLLARMYERLEDAEEEELGKHGRSSTRREDSIQDEETMGQQPSSR